MFKWITLKRFCRMFPGKASREHLNRSAGAKRAAVTRAANRAAKKQQGLL